MICARHVDEEVRPHGSGDRFAARQDAGRWLARGCARQHRRSTLDNMLLPSVERPAQRSQPRNKRRHESDLAVNVVACSRDLDVRHGGSIPARLDHSSVSSPMTLSLRCLPLTGSRIHTPPASALITRSERGFLPILALSRQLRRRTSSMNPVEPNFCLDAVDQSHRSEPHPTIS